MHALMHIHTVGLATIFVYVCVCVCDGGMESAHVPHSMCMEVRGQTFGSQISSSTVGLRDQTQDIRFGSKPLFQQSHLTDPLLFFLTFVVIFEF